MCRSPLFRKLILHGGSTNFPKLVQLAVREAIEKGGLFMNKTEPNAMYLSAPYRKAIGKVTFEVSSFGNPKGTETAQQLMVRLMERYVTENAEKTKEGESA